MTIAIGLMLVVLAAAFVLYPLVRRSEASPLAETAGHQTEAEQRQMLYREIIDLEFEYATGKLSEADLHALTQECLGRAAELLRKSESDQERLEAALEDEIASAREALVHARGRATASARAR